MSTTAHAPSSIIKQLLLDNALGVEPSAVGVTGTLTVSECNAWPIYISHTPDGNDIEDNALTIFDTASVKDGRLMTGSNILHQGVQVLVRANNYTLGWQRSKLLFDLFESVLRNQVLLDACIYTIQSINITSPILPIGIAEDDTKRRDLFSINILLTINEE